MGGLPLNTRVTSYLKIFIRAHKSGKFSPRVCSQLPEIQNTKIFGILTSLDVGSDCLPVLASQVRKSGQIQRPQVDGDKIHIISRKSGIVLRTHR